MDRRNFLKTTGTLIAGATIAPSAFGASAEAGSNAAEGRLLLPINRNWRYSRTVPEGSHDRQFDDSAYERIVIPHTNVKLPWHSFDEKTYEFVSSLSPPLQTATGSARTARLRRLRRRDDRLHRVAERHSPRRIQGRLHALFV